MIGAVVGGIVSAVLRWLSDRITLRGVCFSLLLIPLLLFLKGFVGSTLHLVSSSFGHGTSIVGSSIQAVFGNNLLLGRINQFFQTYLNNNQIFSAGWLLRVMEFDAWVSLASWWIDSLLVIWFFRFVWWCFCRVFEVVNGALSHV